MIHPPLALLVLGASLALGACSDRDADALPEADPIATDGTPDGANEAAGADEPLLLLVAEETEPAVTDPDAVPDGDGLLDPGTAADDELFDPGSTGGDGGTGTDLDGQAVFVPAIPGDPDAARVLDGLSLALGRTLLDLNARLAGGIALDARQDDCLGTYDPAFGEPLTAVDCAEALVAEPAAIHVERGAFYPTSACRAALSAGRTDDCVLAYASVFDRVEFVQAPGERRPRPSPGSGATVRYGLDGPVLSVTSDERTLTGVFRCEIDLATGAALPGGIGDCDTFLRDVAARFDAAFADVR